MLFCSSWWGALNDVSVFYTYPLFTRNTVFGEPLPGNSSLWWTLGIANVLLLHIVTILWNPYQVTSLCYESFFFPRPLSLTSHLVITFIFDVFICVMFYSLNVHRNSPFKIKSNTKKLFELVYEILKHQLKNDKKFQTCWSLISWKNIISILYNF